MNVALATSTWNDVAMTFWRQVYHQSESNYQDWRCSSMTERFAYEKRYLYGEGSSSVYELLSHRPDWLSRKAGLLGCTSSRTILFMCWKEILPNEDAARLGLGDELYALPVNMPTNMCQFASWLEDWTIKLVAADEVSAHTEPRRAMDVLMNVGKPLQTTDNIFMTARVAIFRESGRDDVTTANLQEACLKQVVLAELEPENFK